MPDRPNLIYYYDGSFEGLMCCVFESYTRKEIPINILPSDNPQATLFPVREVLYNPENSSRVIKSIKQKIGLNAFEFIQQAFLTCLPDKELYILLFIRLGFKSGPKVTDMLYDDIVNTLYKAIKHLLNESHLYEGFIRFAISGGILVSEIEPKNYVLPLLTEHFCERFPEEKFLIYDRNHGMLLVYEPYRSAIIPLEDMTLPEPDEDEKSFRQLWKLFYDTIEIKERHNPKCRMGHMPKRYWRYMTEFSTVRKF